MKYWPLVWRNLLRRKIRTIFTLASVFIAFVLFGFLMTVKSAFSMGIDVAGADRMAMMHKVSLIQLLPISYLKQIQSTPGVKLASHATWFGGTYQDSANSFAVMAVDPEVYTDLYPEVRIPEDQLRAWRNDRQGALVGRDVATRYGWKIGDKIPIQATIWQPKEGHTWFFNIDAIYDADKNFDKTNFFFRYDYLEENRRGGYGMVGWYVIKIDDPPHAAAIASALDSQFANSPAETKTSTEKAFMQGFVNQIGNVSAIMIAILSAVMFTLFFLVVANTMAQSVRERTSELAVLKTLGFSDGKIVGLVLAETLIIALIGGGLGLTLTWLMMNSGGFNNAFLPVFALSGKDVAIGAILCAVLGLLAGVLPAMSAMRMRIVDALRRA